MTKDMALPAGRAVVNGAASVSAVPASVPSADQSVFIIERHTGSYEDFRTTPILALYDKDEAERLASEARAEFEMAKELVPSRPYPAETTEDEAAWDAWEAEREADWARFKGYLTIDPSIAPAGAWSAPEDDLAYYVIEVPLATPTEPTPQPSA